eukprot:c3067_g1_i1.p1 GENE.c3067_g1_i1~~c3067_g1_i1.p1  ORF type:complete len:247 (+),score=78.06 c3067_g1_i1:111-851(+)
MVSEPSTELSCLEDVISYISSPFPRLIGFFDLEHTKEFDAFLEAATQLHSAFQFAHVIEPSILHSYALPTASPVVFSIVPGEPSNALTSISSIEIATFAKRFLENTLMQISGNFVPLVLEEGYPLALLFISSEFDSGDGDGDGVIVLESGRSIHVFSKKTQKNALESFRRVVASKVVRGVRAVYVDVNSSGDTQISQLCVSFAIATVPQFIVFNPLQNRVKVGPSGDDIDEMTISMTAEEWDNESL